MKKIRSIFCTLLVVIFMTALFLPMVSAAEPYEDARSSIVRILTKLDGDYMTTGTGFFIGSEGDSVQYIVTNSHVIHFTDDTYVYTPTSLEVIFDGINNQTTLEATVVKDWEYWVEGQPDLAIIKLVAETTLRHSIPLMSATQLGLTETIYAMGFPFISDYDTLNLPSRIEDVTVSKGTVTKQLYEGINGDVDYFQMDAAISGGNSGGPVITEEGYAVGISSYGSTVASGFNYALYMDYIIDFLDTMGIPYDKITDRAASALPVQGDTTGTDVGAADPAAADTADADDIGPLGLPSWAFYTIIGAVVIILAAVIILLLTSRKKTAQQQPVQQQQQPVYQRTVPVSPASQPVQSGCGITGIAGEMKGRVIPVNGIVAIGRDPARCAVAYAASTPGISSEHCRIKAIDNGIILMDIGSTYGTYFENGSKLNSNQEYTLRKGDTFYIGSKDNGFKVL